MDKVANIKSSITIKRSLLWEEESNHSIIQLENDSNATEKNLKEQTEKSNS